MATRKITSWGRYIWEDAEVFEPKSWAGLQSCLGQPHAITPRGNARSYGDAALGKHVISMLGLNRILSFDSDSGVITCEAGVLLSDLIQVIVPKGWFFHVTPGIKSITMGGAIASDVHGKNHVHKGSFSRWVSSFTLITRDGTKHFCTPNENQELFYDTFGAMGMTGIVLEVSIQLMPIQSTRMIQQSIKSIGLPALFQTFEDNPSAQYAAAWLDLTNTLSPDKVRSIVHLANHDESNQLLNSVAKKPLRVPNTPPFNILQKPLMQLYNQMVWAKTKQSGIKTTISMDAYFYPLDQIEGWNKLYGPKGFVQYQFCIPEHQAQTGIEAILRYISGIKEKPYLSVMKKHGERDPKTRHSFPIKGYSLAMDWPASPQIKQIVKDLDDILWPLGAQVYLTKDALSGGRMGRIDFGRWHHTGFTSRLAQRIKHIS